MASFRYSADAEARPDEPFYDAKFQASLTRAQQLATRVRNCLGDSGVELQEGPSLHKLLEESDRLSQFQCSNKRIIGLVGNTGQGKLHLTFKMAQRAVRCKTQGNIFDLFHHGLFGHSKFIMPF
jgi:flagellar biosynthesis GTPase FlhF